MSNLAQEFAARLYTAILECHRLKYHPTRFEQMLQSSDAVTLAKKLVTSGELQDGLKKLKGMDRLDLSMEEIMLESRFAQLFTRAELDAARWRLSQL
ncbi:MAG: hypothetical protein IT488_12630 [Gammaproteobacteria bacterium]|nr:hypothetical protein [Gammaproteobacteria bacterium]